MKNTTALMIFLLLQTVLPFLSCSDPCKDKICYNGYCIGGDCFCQDGYSGQNCETKESEKFVGGYSGQIICPEGQQSFKVKITNNADNPRDIEMNLSNFSVSLNIRGKIRKDSLYIPNQWVQMQNGNTIITNLFMPSKGILRNDSDLEFDLIYFYSADDIDTCRIEVKKN